jgi:transposase
MRRSFDGLALAVQQAMGEDPQSGALFCFVNRRANRLKVLWFDPTGYCILYKRAHGIRFVRPGAGPDGRPSVRIDRHGFAKLVAGVVRTKKTRKR